MADETKVEEKIEEELTTVSPEITVDPEHSSLTGIRADQEADVTAIKDGYGKQIDSVDTMVKDQLQAVDDSTKTLTDAQNKYTEDTINIIEGQKEEAREDLADEQRGAYVDWKQQTDPFGVNAEHMAANGLSSSGFSESSKVRMYQSYQNRKALAYKAFTKAMTEYNNQITMARSQNSVTLAQIASDSIKEKARITLEGFYYKNDLITKQTEAITETNRYYDDLWLDQYDRLYEQEKDKRDFLQRQEEAKQEQANWEALYGEDGLYRKEEEEEEEEEIIIDKDEEPENPDLPEGTVIPPLNFNPENPTLSSGNPVIDGMLDVIYSSGNEQAPSYNYDNFDPTNRPVLDSTLNPTNITGNKSIDDYPNFPKLSNGKPLPLTWEDVGSVENIHTVDRSAITTEFGNISAEKLDELVQSGAVKEMFFEDKDGKIGLTFKIVDKEKADKLLNRRSHSGGGRSIAGGNSAIVTKGAHTENEGYRFK